MKEKRYLIIGLLLGGLIGWALGFLRLPLIKESFSFGVGFLACLGMLGISILIYSLWKKDANSLKSTVVQLKGVNQGQNAAIPGRLSLLIIASLIAVVALFYVQGNYLKNQFEKQNELILQQTNLAASAEKSNALILINDLCREIEAELNGLSKKMLSEEMISRIEALNYSFQPDQYWEGDTMSATKLSSQRGQLLLSLSKIKMDSTSFHQIKKRVSFFRADLRTANLSDVDLSYIDLNGANLEDAVLERTNLSHANLKYTSYQRANLNKVNFDHVNMEGADLRWADLRNATFRNAFLNGINASDAKMTSVDLSDVTLNYGVMKRVALNKASLKDVNMLGTMLTGSNLSSTMLKNVNLRIGNLLDVTWTDANIDNVNFTGCVVAEENWPDYLTEQRVKGAQKIKKTFRTKALPSGLFNFSLVKIED